MFCSMEDLAKKTNHRGTGWEKTQDPCLTKVADQEHKEPYGSGRRCVARVNNGQRLFKIPAQKSKEGDQLAHGETRTSMTFRKLGTQWVSRRSPPS